MQAKSVEHRKLILNAVFDKKSYKKIQEIYGVHPNTTTKLVRQSRALLPSDDEVDAATRQLGVKEALTSITALTKLPVGVSIQQETASTFVTGNTRTLSGDAASNAVFVELLPRDRELREQGVTGYWVETGEHTDAIIVLLRSFSIPIPLPQVGGGLVESTVRLKRRHKIQLAQVLNATRLSLEHAADYIRIHVDESFPRVSNPTLQKVARAMDLRRLQTKTFDPKQIADKARLLEKTAFFAEMDKGAEGALHGENLVFIDESNFHLNMDHFQGKLTWTTPDNPVAHPSKKGRSPYVAVSVSVGLMFKPGTRSGSTEAYTDTSAFKADKGSLKEWKGVVERAAIQGDSRFGAWTLASGQSHLLLMWQLIPPSRQAALGMQYETDEDFSEEESAYVRRLLTRGGVTTPSALLAKLSKADLRETKYRNFLIKALTFLGVEHRVVTANVHGEDEVIQQDAPPEILFERFERAITGNRRGLPRKFFGGRYRGGSALSELSTTSSFMHYVRMLGIYIKATFGKDVLADTRLFLDNAATHGAVRVDTQAASFMHEYVFDLGFKGAVFAPVRNAHFNVAELVFGYVGQFVSSFSLPSNTGEHSPVAMMAYLENGLQEITPAMVAAWTVCRGFQFVGSMMSQQLPIGLDTTTVETTTGETMYVQQRHNGSLIPAPSVRLAYCRQPKAPEDNTDIVDNILRFTKELLTDIASVHERPRVRAVQDVLKKMMRQTSLYATSYEAILSLLDRERLNDALDVIHAVIRHYRQAVVKAQQSKRQLCKLDVKEACSELADTASSCRLSDHHDDVVCMAADGQIVSTKHSGSLDSLGRYRLAPSKLSRPSSKQRRLDFSQRGGKTQMGALEEILVQTGRLIAMEGASIKSDDIQSLSTTSRQHAALKAFADAVVEHCRRGNLRARSAPCSVLLQKETSLQVMINDWNSWASLDRVPAADRSMLVELHPDKHPYYVTKLSIAAFDKRNQWGKMYLHVHGSGYYKHVGTGVGWAVLKRLALSKITDFDSFGAETVQTPKHPPSNDVSFHMTKTNRLPLPVHRQLRATVSELATNLASGDADVEAILKDARDTRICPGDLRNVWSTFLRKLASVVTEGGLNFSDEEHAQKTLTRLLMDMEFDVGAIAEARLFADVSQERSMPLIDLSSARRMLAMRVADASAGSDSARWPGYPVVNYTDTLRLLRDNYLDMEAARRLSEAEHEFLTKFSKFATYVLSPYKRRSFGPDAKVPPSFEIESSQFPSPIRSWGPNTVAQWNQLMQTIHQVDLGTVDEEDQDVWFPVSLLMSTAEAHNDSVRKRIVQKFVNKSFPLRRRDAIEEHMTQIDLQVQQLLKRNDTDDRWLVFRPGFMGKAIVTASYEVVLHAAHELLVPGMDNIGEFLRWGMPFSIAIKTSHRKVPRTFGRAIAAESLLAVARSDPAMAISVIKRSMIDQLQQLSLQPTRTSKERKVIRSVEKTVARTVDTSVESFVKRIAAKLPEEFTKKFELYPVLADIAEYFIITSETKQGAKKFDLEHPDENEDDFVDALISVAIQREKQRQKRQMQLSKQSSKNETKIF